MAGRGDTATSLLAPPSPNLLSFRRLDNEKLQKQSVSETTRELMCGFSRHQGVQEWPTCFDIFSLSSTLKKKKNTGNSFSCFAYLFHSLYLSLVFYFFLFHTRILLYLYSYVTNPPSPCASVFVLLVAHPNKITTAGAIGCQWSVHIPGTGPLVPVSYHFWFSCGL